MKRLLALTTFPALLLVLALAGCAEKLLAPTASDAQAGENAGPALHKLADRPLKGHCETAFRLHPTQPSPPVVRQIDEGTCRLAHLGRADFYSVKDINFATRSQSTTEATFTAANGDILRFIGSGTSAPSAPGSVSFSATLTFVGGTGRYVQASGEAQVKGEANLLTRTASFEIIDGWISYDASDRSGS